ncbi:MULTISPECIES: DUF262 domain-containing HNH endonuclease family protein [unclassified Microcoleus]|uniref:DUF262 domain-containing protein n=1 Tax=unclassified Microcoleus TaxID=2642155 RepID=UPI002FD5CFB9
MENGQKAISDLFEPRRVFNIPKYQRAYAWETKQLQDFINDLDNQILGRDYFFGTILLQIRENEGHFKVIDIVDGQQRLTTLTVFMRLLLDKLSSFGDDIFILRETYVQYRAEYKLRVLEYDQDFFRKCVLEDCEEAEKLIKTPSQGRLLEAKKFFQKELEPRSVENLRELREKIENAKVLTYAVLDNAEATLIFETTNDRGKSLTDLEKIKSFLMYKVYTVADEPERHLKIIQDRFGEIYRDFEEILRHLTVDERFILRNHYITFESHIKEEGLNEHGKHLWLIKKKINALTSHRETFAEATKFIDNYSDGLKQTFSIVKKIAQDENKNLNNLLYILGRVANLFPILIASMKYACGESYVNFSRVTKLLEIMSFRVYGIRKRRLKNTVILKRLYELSQSFNGDFESLISSLKDIIGEFCSDREFRVRLASPDFYEAISTNDLNYLFWQYENHIRRTEYREENQIGFYQYKGLSIEHIVSQRPREISNWMAEDVWSNYINSIGNLVLDLSWENQGKSNRDFSTKYTFFYQNSRFVSQKELTQFKNPENGEWDVSSIENRKNKIIDFASKYWDHKSV